MNAQQLNYAYWQRMRQQQLYRAYVAGGYGQARNSYDKIAKVSDDWFLNYIEYDAKKISPDKANAVFKTQPTAVAGGMCTGVHKGSMHLRQLDWYYNEEAEFIIRMKKCVETGVLYDSIGVTAASPKLTWQTVKDNIESKRYNEYYDILPYLTVDGVNERGIFAQSNVVEVNGIEHININPGKIDCCCSVMLVRFILDHVGSIDELESYLGKLHLYNAPRDKIAYNNHVLVADKLGNTKIIEFKESSFEVISGFNVMTNFRTNGGFHTVGSGAAISADWSSIEPNGIGVERWEAGARFVNYRHSGDLESFKNLRNVLNYTNAYSRPVVKGQTWLTDNLSGDLTVSDALDYHNGTILPERKAVYDAALDGYREMYDTRSRTDGNKTWLTTHGAIYDLANLSCNIQTQQDTCWNVQFDGTVTKDQTAA